MLGILKRIEGKLRLGADEIAEKALDVGLREVSDAPRTPTSFLKQLPLDKWGFTNCPAIPYWANEYGDPDPEHIVATVLSLAARGDVQAMPAYCGLATDYTIDDQTAPAYELLYDKPLPVECGAPSTSPPPDELTLDQPEDFTLSWTTYQGVLKDSQYLVAPFAKTLTDTKTATELFWPTIANFGLPYNLLVLNKVDAARKPTLKAEVGAAWKAEGMEALQAKGLLYEIDMKILASVGPSTALDDLVRFTPGTVTVLKQDPQTKALTPIAITVWTTEDGPPVAVYTGTDKAWLWALQAAKASITVWGIWLGHVYHWHIVTAAMQMTMYNNLPAGHHLYLLLEPQSQSLIDFDFVLLTLLWGQISPPTPVAGYMPLLELLDRFAKDRKFFDDDPLNELKKRGFDETDFTVTDAWDAYPVVGSLIKIWGITGDYVSGVVDCLYKTDTQVANDKGLQAWMAASAAPDQGNVRGLPKTIKTRSELTKVLTSILYRVTVHGAGALNPAVNPALSFVSNYPPCLQRADIPKPSDSLTTEQLLEYLPHTWTIGGMTTFYFTFADTKPDVPLIPSGGPSSNQYFGTKWPNCNKALVTYRTDIGKFVNDYAVAWNDALAGIGGITPGPIPSYAQNQAPQWALSIEI